MFRTLRQQLERDLLTAPHARCTEEQGQREIAELRAELAHFELDLAIIKLKRALHRKFRPDQPRVPAGDPHWGRWASGESGRGGRDQTRVAQYSMGTLVAELPYPGGRNCV